MDNVFASVGGRKFALVIIAVLIILFAEIARAKGWANIDQNFAWWIIGAVGAFMLPEGGADIVSRVRTAREMLPADLTKLQAPVDVVKAVAALPKDEREELPADPRKWQFPKDLPALATIAYRIIPKK